MKIYVIKMITIVLILVTTLSIYQKGKENLTHNYIVNSIVYQSDIPQNKYENTIVYEDLTLEELSIKLDNVLNSTLEGHGKDIASLALKQDVDPVIATSIILVETGCKWNCSYLVKNCNNVGGMKGKGCGSYAKFATLEDGINAFISNLHKNYFSKGLTTPQAINTKYAENPNWHNDVDYYIKLIKAS